MNLYQGLLFLHGHIIDADLAIQLGGERPARVEPGCAAAAHRDALRPRRAWRSLLRNFWMLGGRPMTSGHNDDLEEPFARTARVRRFVGRAMTAGTCR